MKREPEVYDFSAQPRVAGPKPKYREERQEMANLMNDPRVVRGNTYAAVVSTKSEFKRQLPTMKLKKSAKKQTKRTYPNKFEFDSGLEPTTPRAVDNREHFSVQTDAFVEKLRDKPSEQTKECQTDFYLDRPVQRLFNPTKMGVDYATQINEPNADQPDLFSFDYEVEPILDALLSKVLDTSRYELFEQEQLELKQEKNQEYERVRNASLAETQKLESNENRSHEEQQRRQLQFKKVRDQNVYTQKKLVGRVLSKQYLQNLHRNTNAILEEQGFFRQPLEFDLYDNLLPWLYQEVQQDITRTAAVETEAGAVIREFQNEFASRHFQSIANEERRRRDIEKQRLDEIERKQKAKQQRKAQKLRELEQERLRQEELAAQQQAADPSQPPPAT